MNFFLCNLHLYFLINTLFLTTKIVDFSLFFFFLPGDI